jgi:hypothetical protein
MIRAIAFGLLFQVDQQEKLLTQSSPNEPGFAKNSVAKLGVFPLRTLRQGFSRRSEGSELFVPRQRFIRQDGTGNLPHYVS